MLSLYGKSTHKNAKGSTGHASATCEISSPQTAHKRSVEVLHSREKCSAHAYTVCAPCVLQPTVFFPQAVQNKQGLLALTLALGLGCSCILGLRGQAAEIVLYVELPPYVALKFRKLHLHDPCFPWRFWE